MSLLPLLVFAGWVVVGSCVRPVRGLRMSIDEEPAKGAAKSLTDKNLALLRSLAAVDVVDVHYDPQTQDVLNVTSIPATLALDDPAHTKYSVESLRGGITGLRAYFFTSDNNLGEKRTTRMRKQCKELGIKCTRLIPVVGGGKIFELNKELMSGLDIFLRSDPSDIALFVEDDTVFINDFGMNLHQSVMELPDAWTVFHLSSGFLHAPRHHSTSFDLTPESDLEGNPRTGTEGRIYIDWPHGVASSCCSQEEGVLPGGPVGMLITKHGANQIQEGFPRETAFNFSSPDDIILRNIAVGNPGTHFVARQPQLCREVDDEDIEG